MLDTNIKAQLEQYIALLENPIELVMAPDASNASLEMRDLLQQIAALSDKISFREDDSQQRAPSFSVARPGEAPRIRFAGIPLGHEFTSLILALLQTGGRRDPLHRGIDQRHIVVDRPEYRLQVDCAKGPALALQALHPGVPQAAVADETVHEQHAAPTAGSGRQVVGPAAASEGLPPAEDSRRGERLAPPRLQQLGGAGAGWRVVAVQAAEQLEFRGQDE